VNRLLICLILCLIWAGPVWAEGMEEGVQLCRQVVAEFSQKLQGELQAAMQQGGPVNAISICREKAPQIAIDLATHYQIYVRRTSLKARNIKNVSACWERKVLEDFEGRFNQGEKIEDLEYKNVAIEDGDRVLHYMKAIPAKPVCLMCHGSKIAPEVQEQLKKLYPDDEAIGFEVGQIRGAFSLRMPLD